MTRTDVSRISAAAFILILCGCAGPQKTLFRDVAQEHHVSVTPAPSTFDWAASWWMPRHEAVNERLKLGHAGMLFIGNSITHGWEGEGKKIWERTYAARDAVNMGFGGDWTQHVLWRLDHSALEAVSPKLAVVLIGTNNSNGNDCTAGEIADGIIAVCQRLRTRLPEMKILLLAIFPREPEPCAQREKITQANRLASRIADGRTIFYADFSALFLNPDGTIRNSLMPDSLHPNGEGYRLWAEAMEPWVSKIMGE